jgi:AraC-like DNA-binding protein
MDHPAMPAFADVDFARGRLFDTADVDEAREVCGRVFNPHQLRVIGPGQRLRSRMDHLPLGGVSLNRLTWGARVAVDPGRLDSYYLLSVPVAGSARFHLGVQTVDVSPRCACIVNAAQPFRFETTADFDQIVIRFEREAVDSTWQALAGTPASAAIDFVPALPMQGPAWRALEPALHALAACARGDYLRQGLKHAQARIADMLLTTLMLHQLPALATAGAVSHARSGVAHVRRAQSHMIEHLEDALTPASVARACGVAVRTLQAAFQSECAMGPMQWLRERRLDAVREALGQAADGRRRVTETALRLGFTHLGEFSSAYRQRFGETPRDTLARAR